MAGTPSSSGAAPLTMPAAPDANPVRSIRCNCATCAGRIHFLCIADWLDHTSPESGEARSRAAHPSNRGPVPS